MSAGNVLITGVHGIGGALAKCYLAADYKVYIVDRDAAALKKYDHANLVKIEADVGMQAGVDKIKSTIGDAPLTHVCMLAAAAADQGGNGAPLATITRDEMQDMISTSVYGKLFLMQAIAPNLKASPTKARVFNVGAPFADGKMEGGPMEGKYMCVPGWIGYGVAKSASKYLWEGMKVEMADVALFGYGHPGLTRTPLTEYVYDNYKKDMMISKMVTGRFDKKDYHMPEEMGELFFTVATTTSDEDFQGKTWNIQTMAKTFPQVKITPTSDVGAGIQLPADDADSVSTKSGN